ncbi:hypothetical protein RZ532_17700 [Nitratireductor aquimarinus]|uniref:hypothetical protein n=1 Tax=Nitratireductor aquimarinus TaxID=889300 RepID=UPI00293589D5|nr:hypothetical protein [Nitratireductor aquimarinus]MDV2967830.1 hypothetical protein [Nitratireductor aquimarinus]
MPVFEYRFVNQETGRTNRKKLRAFDEEELREILSLNDVEVTEIRPLPYPPATERQIELLIDRGVAIPPGLNKREASDLVSNLLEGRAVADVKDFVIAAALRVEVTRFASKATIYKCILFTLLERGSIESLGAWYAYRVYRNAFDRNTDGRCSPLDGCFKAIGERVAADERLALSLRRVARNSTVHFRWFGTLVTPRGEELRGDGVDSAVYAFVRNELFDAGLISNPRPPEFRYLEHRRGSASSELRARSAATVVPDALHQPPQSKDGTRLRWGVLAAVLMVVGIWLVG